MAASKAVNQVVSLRDYRAQKGLRMSQVEVRELMEGSVLAKPANKRHLAIILRRAFYSAAEVKAAVARYSVFKDLGYGS